MKEPKDKKCQLTLDHRSKESIQQVTITKSSSAKKETVDRNKISIFTDNWDIFTEQVIDSSYSNVTICGIYYTTILHTICGIYYTTTISGIYYTTTSLFQFLPDKGNKVWFITRMSLEEFHK